MPSFRWPRGNIIADFVERSFAQHAQNSWVSCLHVIPVLNCTHQFLFLEKITSYVSKPLDADVEAIEDNENYMRICAMCKEHLQRYELRKDLNSVSSVFIDLYAKLTTLITQINNLTPSYRRMAMSLQSGESLYTLESATQLKKKIVYIQSEIKNLR